MKAERNTRAIANAIAESVHHTTPGGWAPRMRLPWWALAMAAACVIVLAVLLP